MESESCSREVELFERAASASAPMSGWVLDMALSCGVCTSGAAAAELEGSGVSDKRGDGSGVSE